MNNIKALRLSKDLKQSEFCKIIQCSQGTLSNWETGRTEPDISSQIKMADFFAVSIDYLLGREEKEPHIDVELSSEEAELIKQFRALSPQGQSHVLATAQLLGTTGKEQILP